MVEEEKPRRDSSQRRERIMQKGQKTYTAEFKREAVRLAQTSGKPIAQVARELGISDPSIQECAQGTRRSWRSSLPRQWASNRPRRRSAPAQARVGDRQARA